MAKHHCGGLLVVVILIVLMFSSSMEPTPDTKGDAFSQSIAVTNVLLHCHSKNNESPLDIARAKGHNIVVSLMIEALACELMLFSLSVAAWDILTP